MERNDIFIKLREIIAEVLEEKPEEIQMEDSLVDDLGIESIDLLDINSKIEQTFSIEIKNGELWNFTADLMNDELFQDGLITKKGVDVFSRRITIPDCEKLIEGTPASELLSYFKINTIVDYIEEKLRHFDIH